jgi:hypothetical protein
MTNYDIKNSIVFPYRCVRVLSPSLRISKYFIKKLLDWGYIEGFLTSWQRDRIHMEPEMNSVRACRYRIIFYTYPIDDRRDIIHELRLRNNLIVSLSDRINKAEFETIIRDNDLITHLRR